MRLKDIAPAHRQLLRQLTGRISKRLTAEFTELPMVDGPNIGVRLQERGRAVVGEVSETLLRRADGDVSAREAIRVHIKTTRDRMLFRPQPKALPKNIKAASQPPPDRRGRGRF
jgi:hypothetical protein